MITLSKMLLFMGLIMLVMSLARTGFAQPEPGDIGIDQGEIEEPGMGPRPAEDMEIDMQRAGAPPAGIPTGVPTGVPTGIPMGMLISEQGVALKDNKTYAVRIIVECLMPMEPRRVQKLLASNKSLEEIKDAIAIGASQGEPMYHGNMLLDERIYSLINIRIAFHEDNISNLEADVAKPNQDPALVNEKIVVGHVWMKIAPSDNGMVGIGELWMKDSYHPGTHSVLIDIVSSRKRKTAWNNGDKQDPPRLSSWSLSDKEG